MTTAFSYPYTTPDTYCSVAGCWLPADTISLYTGRRCRLHRPRFSPAVATALDDSGWPHTAQAYRRTFLGAWA